MNESVPEFQRPAAAAKFLGVTVRTLQSWTAAGRLASASLRPDGARHGVRLYRTEDLRAFVASKVTAPAAASQV